MREKSRLMSIREINTRQEQVFVWGGRILGNLCMMVGAT